MGNTCYVNAILQCISNNKPFMSLLDSYTVEGNMVRTFAGILDLQNRKT